MDGDVAIAGHEGVLVRESELFIGRPLEKRSSERRASTKLMQLVTDIRIS
jgi:hypothetical protein